MRQVRQEAAAATATNNSNSWLMTMSTVVISQLSSPIADTTGQVRQGVRAGGAGGEPGPRLRGVHRLHAPLRQRGPAGVYIYIYIYIII